MCGRFVQKDLRELADAFGAILRSDLPPSALVPRHNIAPTQTVGIIGRNAADTRSLTCMRWGLVPGWARDDSGGGKLFNARSESAAEKPSFRAALRHRRAVIPADGFYEWQTAASRERQPWYISRADGAPMAFAALWEVWRGGTAPLFTCTILTVAANDDIADLHERMPVLLDGAAIDAWLDPATDAAVLHGLMRPASPGSLRRWPVALLVNGTRHDSPDLMQPAMPVPEPMGALL